MMTGELYEYFDAKYHVLPFFLEFLRTIYTVHIRLATYPVLFNLLLNLTQSSSASRVMIREVALPKWGSGHTSIEESIVYLQVSFRHSFCYIKLSEVVESVVAADAALLCICSTKKPMHVCLGLCSCLFVLIAKTAHTFRSQT